MIKVTAYSRGNKSEVFYKNDDKVDEIRAKIISQINNGHVVVLGEGKDILLNPKHIEAIQIEKVDDDQEEN